MTDSGQICVKLDDETIARTGVTSYFFNRRDDLFLELVVNTVERGVLVHLYSDNQLEIDPPEDKIGPLLDLDPRFTALANDGVIRWPFTMCERDQVYMLFVPHEFLCASLTGIPPQKRRWILEDNTCQSS